MKRRLGIGIVTAAVVGIACVVTGYILRAMPSGPKHMVAIIRENAHIPVKEIRLLPDGPILDAPQASEFLYQCRVPAEQTEWFHERSNNSTAVHKDIRLIFGDETQVVCSVRTFEGGDFTDIFLAPPGDDDVFGYNYFQKKNVSPPVAKFFEALGKPVARAKK